MTFAEWERQVRFLDDTVRIFTTTDKAGAVVIAFTSRGEIWSRDDQQQEPSHD